jgi:hypothetical protein
MNHRFMIMSLDTRNRIHRSPDFGEDVIRMDSSAENAESGSR